MMVVPFFPSRISSEEQLRKEIYDRLAPKKDQYMAMLDMDDAELVDHYFQYSEELHLIAELQGTETTQIIVGDGAKLCYDALTAAGIPAKAMGMRKGIDHQCKQVAAKPADPAHPFYVMYTNNRTVAESFASRLETVGVAVPENRIIQVGAAIGSHIGPDACGFVYVAKK